MKFWEALKAVDEGKKVQFKSTDTNTWYDQESLVAVEVGVGNKHEWRIKPEPQVLYVNFYPSGDEYNYRTKESAIKNAASGVVTKKFIEVVDEG